MEMKKAIIEETKRRNMFLDDHFYWGVVVGWQ